MMVNSLNKPNRINSLSQNESASKSMDNYNKSSSMQLKWIKLGRKNIELAVGLLKEDSDSLKIVDFACSHGKNSMTVINQMFDELTENRPSLASKLKNIIIYHNDLPDNDFDEVLKCVEDQKIGYRQHKLILSNNASLFTKCVGKTYYEQIAENETVDFAFCYTSLHWMPEYRGLTYGLIYEKEYEHRILSQWFDEMSHKYIIKWLELRCLELKPSGLLSFNICTMTNFLDILNTGWASLLKSKEMNESALSNVTVPVYFRTKEQVDRALAAVKDKYKVIHMEYMVDQTPLYKPAFKAVTYNQLLSGLSKYRRLFPNKESIDQFYQELEDECFKSSIVRTLHTGFQWILLQKI